jgi:hypothetical protein
MIRKKHGLMDGEESLAMDAMVGFEDDLGAQQGTLTQDLQNIKRIWGFKDFFTDGELLSMLQKVWFHAV